MTGFDSYAKHVLFHCRFYFHANSCDIWPERHFATHTNYRRAYFSLMKCMYQTHRNLLCLIHRFQNSRIFVEVILREK
ncbi:hypothetical protein OBV_17190 [Oscillibacter valericigenes Sjm18-20]|nr:hypothetical protein OBV_17190 [Oscillibacter valericigenes Sjm18-20]